MRAGDAIPCPHCRGVFKVGRRNIEPSADFQRWLSETTELPMVTLNGKEVMAGHSPSRPWVTASELARAYAPWARERLLTAESPEQIAYWLTKLGVEREYAKHAPEPVFGLRMKERPGG